MSPHSPANLRGRRRERGFTLIELLVVIGLIVLLAGAVGVALRDGDRSSALQAAQGTLASLFGGVRAKAALHQTDAALLVDTDPASDTFLRSLRIGYKDTDGKWVVDETTVLPSGIYVVPPSGAFVEVQFSNGWTDKRVTTPVGKESIRDLDANDANKPFANLTTGTFRILSILTPYGTRKDKDPNDSTEPADDENKLVLGPAEKSAPTGNTSRPTLQFTNPDLVRGAVISHYGVLSLINDPNGFNDYEP